MYPRIVVDKRERASKIPKLLREVGINVDLATLMVGDYIISSSIGVERKTVIDLSDHCTTADYIFNVPNFIDTIHVLY